MAERRGPWNSLSQIVGRIEDLEAAVAALEGLDWQNSVLSRFDPSSGLPGSPSDGDRYISTDTANGWTENNIYQYDLSTTSWEETVADEGMAAWVEDENKIYVFNGADWVLIGTIITTNKIEQGDSKVEVIDAGTGKVETYIDSTLVLEVEGNEFRNVRGRIISGVEDSRQGEFIAYGRGTGLNEGGVIELHPAEDHDTIIPWYRMQVVQDDLYIGPSNHIAAILYDGGNDKLVFTGRTDPGGVELWHKPAGDGGSVALKTANPNKISLNSGAAVNTIETTLTDDDEHIPTSGAVFAAVGGALMSGQQAIANAASTVTVTFGAAESDTNYYITATLENTTDSPPSIYAIIVSGKTVNGFTVTLSGVTDSANYKLNWHLNR